MLIDVDIILKWFQFNRNEPMLFQTIPFFVLFSVFYLVYSLFLQRIQFRNILLLIFSLFFYYKISGLFVIVLVGMALSDFLIGHLIFRAKSDGAKRLWMYASFLINLGALIYFKYTTFFIDIINDISNSHLSLSFKILQPIGISYFVFKSLSYVIDMNREMIEKPEKNFISYLVFVAYFPNILAGPITKARDFIPQLNVFKKNTSKEVSLAIFLISLGLIKKIAVADIISANITDRVFESPQFFTSFDLFMSAYGGLLNLYFDFSGYTDMALGISLLMGMEMVGNFNQPFKASNITDFWKRWHMSLYAWLSDYVYQPIAFSLRKLKMVGAVLAVFFTFLISGLWHGANLTFVLWGLLHGTVIVLEMMTQKGRAFLKKYLKFPYLFLSIFLTFNFLAFSSVLIKSPDLDFAIQYYQRILSGIDFNLFSKWFSIYKIPFIVMISALACQFLPIKWYSLLYKGFGKLPVFIMALLFCILMIALYQVASKDALPFIYIEY